MNEFKSQEEYLIKHDEELHDVPDDDEELFGLSGEEEELANKSI